MRLLFLRIVCLGVGLGLFAHAAEFFEDYQLADLGWASIYGVGFYIAIQEVRQNNKKGQSS